MKTSTTRILTTHAGSLPRPDRLVELNAPKFGGEAVDQEALTACLAQALTVAWGAASTPKLPGPSWKPWPKAQSSLRASSGSSSPPL